MPRISHAPCTTSRIGSFSSQSATPYPESRASSFRTVPDAAARGITHEAQPRSRSFFERLYERSERLGVGEHLRLQLQVSARDQDGRAVISQSSGAEDLVSGTNSSGR